MHLLKVPIAAHVLLYRFTIYNQTAGALQPDHARLVLDIDAGVVLFDRFNDGARVFVVLEDNKRGIFLARHVTLLIKLTSPVWRIERAAPV